MKLSKSFCGKNTATAILAATIALSTLQVAFAQSSADGSSTSAATSGADSSSTTAAASAAPLPGDSSSSASSSSSSAASTPSSDIPPGVLWTDPKYAVKEVPQPKAPASTKPQPTTGTTTTTTTTTTGAAAATVAPATSTGYDETAAQAFIDSVSSPQYVWTKQEKTKKSKASAANTSKEMAAYNRTIVEKFVANMSVPNSATLVENSSSKYVYLLSFTIDAKGKISKINSESSYGPFTAVHLADDSENSLMTNSAIQALSKCSPVKVPPAGTAPWYMLLKYDPNTGKVFVAHLNSI